MTDSTDPTESPLLSPVLVGLLAWGAAVLSFGHRELHGTWPAEFGGVTVALFAGLGIVLIGYSVVARETGVPGVSSSDD